MGEPHGLQYRHLLGILRRLASRCSGGETLKLHDGAKGFVIVVEAALLTTCVYLIVMFAAAAVHAQR